MMVQKCNNIVTTKGKKIKHLSENHIQGRLRSFIVLLKVNKGFQQGRSSYKQHKLTEKLKKKLFFWYNCVKMYKFYTDDTSIYNEKLKVKTV